MSFAKDLNDANFKELLSNDSKPALVYYGAPWSQPSLATLAALKELTDLYSAKLDFFCVNVDENANLPAMRGIQKIPTLQISTDKENWQSLVGRHEKRRIKQFIEEYFSPN